MAKIYLFIIVMGILGGVGYGGYAYYQWSQNTIALLRENNVKLKSAAETMENTINNMQADAERNEQLNKQLSQKLQQAEGHLDKLRSKFAKIDLTMEAITNPQGLEERVDRAVERLFEQIAKETGAVKEPAPDLSTKPTTAE